MDQKELSGFDRVTEDGIVERFCPSCREYKDKQEHFRKNPDGGNREFCRVCDKIRKNEKRGKQLKAACGELVKQLVTGKATPQIEVPHTSELAAEIVKGLGGLGGLSKMASDAMKAAYAYDPTSRASLEWAKLVFGIVVKSTDQRETAPDVPTMTEEELNTELSAMIGKLLNERPDLLEEMTPARITDGDE
jgi:hypothetical protein